MAGSRARIGALLAKEILELRRNPGILIPNIVLAGAVIALPLIVLLAVPALTGEQLSDDAEIRHALELARGHLPALRDLSLQGATQAFILQQFLMLFILVPVAGAMTLASHSVVGEKQGRTLEPLLASPISTAELLGAKVLGAALPAFALEAVSLAIYFAAVAGLAEPGVLRTLATVRTVMLTCVFGPLATLVALQLAVIVSSRVQDARSAQQIGVLVILPIVGLMVTQLMGIIWLTTAWLILIAATLGVLVVLLMLFAVAIFDRESILTKWK